MFNNVSCSGNTLVTSSVVTVIPVTFTAVVRRVNSVYTVDSAANGGCVGSPKLREALINSNLTAALTSLFNNPTGAACNRGANILTLAEICSPEMVEVTTCFTITMSFFPVISMVVNSVPDYVVNNVSFILCNVVSTVNIEGIIRGGISFAGDHGLVITTIVLIYTLNLSDSAMDFAVNDTTVALSPLTITSVTNVILGTIFPNGSCGFSARSITSTMGFRGRIGPGRGGRGGWFCFGDHGAGRPCFCNYFFALYLGLYVRD